VTNILSHLRRVFCLFT